MKSSIKFFTLSILFSLFALMSNAAVEKSTYVTKSAIDEVGLEKLENITVEEFLSLTPKKVEEITGQKLGLKQSIGLKVAQKKLKKELKKGNVPAGGDSQIIALILVLVVGALGIHRFYLGYIGIGIIQLLTLGGCGIWALVDLIRIITGDLQPKDGPYEETL